MTRARLLLVAVVCGGWPAAAHAAVPSIVSSLFTVSDTSDEVVTVSGLQAGDRIYILLGQTASASRTYTVTDSEGVGNVYGAVVNNNCGTGRCAAIIADETLAIGDGSIDLTVDQNSTWQPYSFWAIVVRGGNAGGELQSSIVGSAANTAAASSPPHYAAASGELDTGIDVLMMTACAGSSTFGTETAKMGFAALTEDTSSNVYMGQYRTSTTALTDERGEMTSGSARDSWCVSVAVSSAVPASTGPPLGGFGMMEVGR